MIKGTVKVDRRTKDLVKRLSPGDIALIDHVDLDEVSAESLVEKRVAAVINAKPFSSGRYPNTGPILLSGAGIALIDRVGETIFERVNESDLISISGGKISKSGRLIGRGEALSADKIQLGMDRSRATISSELGKFATNTLNYVSREKDTLLGRLPLPDLRTRFPKRHALVVVRGYDYKADLAALKPYIREMRPVLIGVDGGADALIKERLEPDLIVGDMDSVSDEALRSGAELVCHGYPDGRAPGRDRLGALGLDCHVVSAGGTSEDLAMLIPYELGAELIVAVGTHGHLIEFLDKGREGMASTFLTRLKVGDRLVDAKGVSQLYRSSPSISHLLFLIGAALTTLSVVILQTPMIRLYVSALLVKLKLLVGV